MKTNLIFILCFLLSGITFGQIQEEKMRNVGVDEVKVTPPKFTGVQNALTLLNEGKVESIHEYLAKNIIYPEKDAKYFNQGTEVMQFTVSTTGEVSDFVVINSVSPQIDEEVISILQNTNGMWIPGYNNSNPVEMEKEVYVTFRINGVPHPLDFNVQGTKYFVKGGELLLVDNNPKKALKFYDKAVKLLPFDESILLMRGFARYETGDKDGANSDWQRIVSLGHSLNSAYLSQITELKGYAEFVDIIYK